MTLCSNNGSLLKEAASMDPYSSSFFRPDSSSAGAEHVMHCGPVQDNATAVKPSANRLEEPTLNARAGGGEEVKKEELGAYPLSSLQKLVDSVPCSKGSPVNLSLQGPSWPEVKMPQTTSGQSLAPSLADCMRSVHPSFVKHHHISIVELPESSLRIKKSQSCDDSSSTKTEIEELEQFSEGEENVLDNGLDLPSDYAFGNSVLTGGFTMPFSSNDRSFSQQSRTRAMNGHLSMDSSVAETKSMETSSLVLNKDGSSQMSLRSKRKKKAETFVEKAASIVGNRGNDDVDDLVAFINSTSEEDKASALKKTRKSKVKQPRPSPSQRGEADHESHKESVQDKSKPKSLTQKSKAKIVSVSSKDNLDPDKRNNNDSVEMKKPQPIITTSTSNSSTEDKILGPEIVNRTPSNRDQDVHDNAQNYSIKSNADKETEPKYPVEEKQNVSKCQVLLNPQGPPANERKAEGPSSKGNPKLSKQSKPPIGTLISSRLPPSSSNPSKPRSSKQQQTHSSKKTKSESEVKSNPEENETGSEKMLIVGQDQKLQPGMKEEKPSLDLDWCSEDQDPMCALQQLGSHHPVTRSNAKKMGDNAQVRSSTTPRLAEGHDLAGTINKQNKDSGSQLCNSPRMASNRKFHPDPVQETHYNHQVSETKQHSHQNFAVAPFPDTQKFLENYASQVSAHQETNGYPKPHSQDYRFRHTLPPHIGHRPVEMHNPHGQKFLQDMHPRHRHQFRPPIPRLVPPAEVQIQLQQQALQDVHLRSLRQHAAQKQPIVRNGSDQGESLPRPKLQEGTQQPMGPVATSTKDDCDDQHDKSKILDEKGNLFNLDEVVNFLRQEWDLVSNENLSNRPVYFNSN